MQAVAATDKEPSRVLIVDDHDAVREELRALLADAEGWEVVGEAASGEEAVELAGALHPDVILMDCKMPGQGGIAATREIVHRWPDVAVVAHTAYPDDVYVREMLAAGARGYILKGDGAAAVLEALAAVAAGGARLSPEVAGAVIDDLRAVYRAAQARSPQLEREVADLSTLLERLDEVDKLKDQFLAMVSDELRTPITVILGIAQTLNFRPELAASQEGQEILGRMLRQARRLRDLVEQLLKASAFAADRWPVLQRELVPVDRVVLEVVADLELVERPAAVRVRLPEDPRPVVTDGEALRTVVVCLLDNAAKHTLGEHPIELTVEQPPGRTRITVADHGKGVAVEDRQRIFAPFLQLGPTTTRQVNGVGIGLYLVKRLVTGMGGEVWVEENPGGGARFVVELLEREGAEQA